MVVYNAVNQRPATTVVGFLLFDPNVCKCFFYFLLQMFMLILLFDPNVYAFLLYDPNVYAFWKLLLTLSLFRQNFPFPEVSRTIFSTLSPKSNHSGSFFPMMMKKFITNIDEEKIIIYFVSFQIRCRIYKPGRKSDHI